MSGLRIVYRTIRALLLLYGIGTALLRSRWLAVGIGLWRVLRKKRIRDPKRTAMVTFVNAGEPAVYRRLGWRKLVLGRRQA